jgi:hypothetical protein
VQLLETGSVKAKEAAALVLRNLCCHSEDIRACVQSTEAVPALLHLLENAGIKATLDDYAAKISVRGDKEFSPVYPLMLQLGSPLAGNTPGSKGY